MTKSSIVVDGQLDSIWSNAEWQSIDQNWLGDAYSKNDFEGKYKLMWDNQYLYVFAEIIDDTLIDIHSDALDRYWDDDCLEVFIDEDASKGIHQYNHNAFAYHISLVGKVADMGPDSLPHIYNHIKSKRVSSNNISHWELAISIYTDSYNEQRENTPVILKANKRLGFAIAYCDNDYSIERENFIGSVSIEGEDKNRGWIDAGIFKTMTLTK